MMLKKLTLLMLTLTTLTLTTASVALACGGHGDKEAKASCGACSGEDHHAHKETKTEQAKVDPNVKLTSASMRVIGWHCQGCADKTLASIKGIEGVASAEVNLDKKELTVQFDAKKTDLTKIEAAIAELGYKVSKQEPAKAAAKGKKSA